MTISTTEVERRTFNRLELQKVTGLSRTAVLAGVKSGVFPNIGSQRRILVPKAAVLRYLGETA